VREFGTLKALGWPVRRVVGQVMAESLVQGLIGAILGIALGFGGAALVTHFAPTLNAYGPGGGDTASGHGLRTSGAGLGSHSIPIHLTAQVQTDAIFLAVGLAIAGGLLAGIFGGWRAARLRPAEALRRVE
jgi:ABC-type antimicrobial peptide transport system permease subunit